MFPLYPLLPSGYQPPPPGDPPRPWRTPPPAPYRPPHLLLCKFLFLRQPRLAVRHQLLHHFPPSDQVEHAHCPLHTHAPLPPLPLLQKPGRESSIGTPCSRDRRHSPTTRVQPRLPRVQPRLRADPRPVSFAVIRRRAPRPRAPCSLALLLLRVPAQHLVCSDTCVTAHLPMPSRGIFSICVDLLPHLDGLVLRLGFGERTRHRANLTSRHGHPHNQFCVTLQLLQLTPSHSHPHSRPSQIPHKMVW